MVALRLKFSWLCAFVLAMAETGKALLFLRRYPGVAFWGGKRTLGCELLPLGAVLREGGPRREGQGEGRKKHRLHFPPQASK